MQVSCARLRVPYHRSRYEPLPPEHHALLKVSVRQLLCHGHGQPTRLWFVQCSKRLARTAMYRRLRLQPSFHHCERGAGVK